MLGIYAKTFMIATRVNADFPPAPTRKVEAPRPRRRGWLPRRFRLARPRLAPAPRPPAHAAE